MKMHARIALGVCGLALLAGRAAEAQIRTGHRTGDGSVIDLRSHKDGRKKKKTKTEMERMAISAARHMDQAETLLAQGKPAQACRELMAAKTLLVAKPLAERWVKIARQLNEVASGQLQEAHEVYNAGDYVKALAAYRRIATAFSGLPAAGAAANGLAEAQANPEVEAALKEIRAAKLFEQVRNLVAAARRPVPATRPAEKAKPPPEPVAAATLRALPDARLLRAVDSLANLVKACSGAPTAQRCAALLKQLESDPPTKARLDRLRRGRRVHAALAKAQMYHKGGMLKKAAAMYRQVIQDFPGTPEASKAAAGLGTTEAQLGLR